VVLRDGSPAIAGGNSSHSLSSPGRSGRAGAVSLPTRRSSGDEYRHENRSHRPPSESLRHVRYEIRGRLARRAHEMQRMGYEIVSLNIGNPGAFGFRTPETMRLAMIENLSDAEGYCHQKGIFPAREAVVMQQQGRGVTE